MFSFSIHHSESFWHNPTHQPHRIWLCCHVIYTHKLDPLPAAFGGEGSSSHTSFSCQVTNQLVVRQETKRLATARGFPVWNSESNWIHVKNAFTSETCSLFLKRFSISLAMPLMFWNAWLYRVDREISARFIAGRWRSISKWKAKSRARPGGTYLDISRLRGLSFNRDLKFVMYSYVILLYQSPSNRNNSPATGRTRFLQFGNAFSCFLLRFSWLLRFKWIQNPIQLLPAATRCYP